MNTNENNVTTTPAEGKAPVIYLGLDVHAQQITVCRQLDGAAPQPAQKFSWPALLAWVSKQVQSGTRVYSCYEAGAFGYGLHRQLGALGVENLVVAPQCWDQRGRRVKTDGRDSRELCLRLERYVHGQRHAFSVVRVPTLEQEQRRALCRQRGAVVRQRQAAAVRGRSLMLLQGHRVSGAWWAPRCWVRLRVTLAEPLRTQVALWQKAAGHFAAEEKLLRAQIEALAPAQIPRGVGALSWVAIGSEVLDWSRFKNRREVASYTGLCPSEHSSDRQRRQGSINRHGNPRLRHALIELIWRLLRWQPDYHLWKKFPLLREPKAERRQRKRQAVGAARHLVIDLWRLATGQTQPEALGLRLPGTTPP
jgi:transposase